MNTLRRSILLGFVFFSMLSFFSARVQAEPAEVSLTVKSSFCLDDQYYVCLSDNSHFVLNKVLIHKGSGWFGVDKYGNPAASWLIGDPVSIQRTGEYDWPFQIVNLYTQQGAFATLVNFEARNYERIQDRLRDLLNVLKGIQNDLSVIKCDIKTIRQENFLKRSAPAN
ncbi:hypothetical protein [Candidatus Rhabdochlamydia porcellionis]|jgi:hypothetical protein|uniref:Secreted protein n=1 Tax=Candidatus Rhabdochlamydia porcellionis TaxID=225148 RepID=A0ABX8Z107_9BACT|nr:hypothetical protein [Candidatus Rhabdochlamydia porcellionis]QZA59030.1 hypothetical protein RHAB15C_0000914 [Candidatus Rhabdochlamydia porcellionis]